MIKNDKELLWRPGREFYPISTFSGIIGAAGVSAGVGVGAPIQAELGTITFVGLLMDTAADEISHLTVLPYDFDTSKNLYYRVHFTTESATAADTIEWLVRYTQVIPNVTTLIDPATAATKDIVSMTVTGTALSYQVTSWGHIGANVISQKAEAIAWEVELQAFAAGLTEAKYLLGLEIMYTPKRLQGPDGMAEPAKATSSKLGKAF